MSEQTRAWLESFNALCAQIVQEHEERAAAVLKVFDEYAQQEAQRIVKAFREFNQATQQE